MATEIHRFVQAYPHFFDSKEYILEEGPRTIRIFIKTQFREVEHATLIDKLNEAEIDYTLEMTAMSASLETIIMKYDNKTLKMVMKPLIAGAQVTALGEQAQVIYCALAQKGASLDYGSVLKNYASVTTGFKISDTPATLLKKLPRQWQLSCERAAPVIVAHLKHRGNYSFHRGTPTVAKINSTFMRLNRKLPAENKFREVNKWNPADIWAFRSGFQPVLSTIKSMEELNGYLLEQSNSGNMYGISLKMSIQPKITYVNYTASKDTRNVGSYSYTKPLLVTKGKDLLSAKGQLIILKKNGKEYKVDLRSHSPLRSWNAEIYGATANHGKMSYGQLRAVAKEITGKQLPDALEIRDRAKKLDQDLIDEIYNLVAKYDTPGLTKEQYQYKVIDRPKNQDWIWSRYLGLKVVDLIETIGKDKQEQLIDAMMTHMSSQKELSAPHIKVS